MGYLIPLLILLLEAIPIIPYKNNSDINSNTKSIFIPLKKKRLLEALRYYLIFNFDVVITGLTPAELSLLA